MSRRTALVICKNEDFGSGVGRKLLGLSVGERLLLTLAKAGFTRAVFLGNGPRPTSPRNPLEIVDADTFLKDVDTAVAVPSDLVFDPALLAEGQPLSPELPLRRLTVDEAVALVRNPRLFDGPVSFGNAGGGKGFALRVTDKATAKAATRCLMLSLHKDADGIISRHLNRKISTFISKRIAATAIKPNHVTAVVFLIGAAAGPLAYLGTHLGFALGGFCYWFSAVLDGCDGEISRLKYQGSALGAWLDTVVDDLVCLSYVTGMYFGLDRLVSHPYWSYLGFVAIGFFLLTIFPRYYIMARRGSGDYQKLAKAIRKEEVTGFQKIVLHLRDIVFRTDFLPFAGMVTAVIGLPEVFAVPFAAGAVASAVDTFHTLITVKPS